MEYPQGATPLDADEMLGLKFTHIETRAELDELEQENIEDGYKWLAQQRKHRDYLSEKFVIDLHKQLFGKVWHWAGKFRKTAL